MTTQQQGENKLPSGASGYCLPVPADERAALAKGWLLLGVASLLGSGILSMLLVLSRTPYVQKIIPWVDFFHVALVVHVDLSVLVWFLAFAGVLWSLAGSNRASGLGWLALALASAGAITMTLAPFVGNGGAIMSNYIPVLRDPLFIWGLLVFGAGIVLLVLRSLLTPSQTQKGEIGALNSGLFGAAIATAVALLVFGWSYLVVPSGLDAKGYYEILFWGGGHALQFTYTLLMLVAWLWLASACGATVSLTPRVSAVLFGLAGIAVIFFPVVYALYDPVTVENRRWLTWLMQFGGGLAVFPIALAILLAMLKNTAVPETAKPLHAALTSSIFLFGVGGMLGFMISGSNVKIPSHYHGCIVGITLAFMGITYYLLPRLGFGKVPVRLATWQPYVYAVGQLLHITGLVWSGGYGVQRKVAGSEQVLRTSSEVAGMALMGLGGLIAIIGGFLFLLVVYRSLRAKPR
jgi:cytochrome c oxidase subunit 1